jgi:hypothetical protein
MDLINEMFRENPAKELTVASGRKYSQPRTHVVCKDGFTASIQASEYHYCDPRIDNAERYVTVEVGFPSEKVDEWMEYIDGGPDADPTETVYGYVPVYLVETALIEHGGIDYQAMKEKEIQDESTFS